MNIREWMDAESEYLKNVTPDDTIPQMLERLESVNKSALDQQNQISQRVERLEDKVGQYIAEHEAERRADNAKHKAERRWNVVRDIACGAIGGIIVLLFERFVFH